MFNVQCSMLLLFSFSFSTQAETPAFNQAVTPREWSFPKDHGRHENFKTEWWYFTGNLKEKSTGRLFGYQFTFFRSAMIANPTTRPSPWAMTDLYFAHAAISDVKDQKFLYTDRLSRGRENLAHASADSLNVILKDWSAKTIDNTLHLTGKGDNFTIDLTTNPTTPILQGPGGRNPKGQLPAQASYYYSMIQMPTTGTLTIKDQTFEVTGHTWMDHEFSSNALAENQSGWDWFALNLNDGTNLMIYRLRDKSGNTDYLSGTKISPTGEIHYLRAEEITLTPSASWKSPISNATYPQQWAVKVVNLPPMKIKTRITNQELQTPNSTNVTYYEGTVEITTESGVSAGEGYLEMTGYAGAIPK